MPVPNRSDFENAYAGQAPWDIGRPQAQLVGIADQVVGSILDAGCGTGETALLFAQRGHKVTGIDFLSTPIERAKQKAAERGIAADFLVKDALTLKDWSERFETVIDSGLLHVFSDDDRKTYVAGLATVLRPGGKLYLLCFSNEEPGTQGPRRLSREDVESSFASGWKIESLQPTQFEVRPDLKDLNFSEGGPKGWFVVARRA